MQITKSFVLWPWFCDCQAPEMSTPPYLGQKPHMLHLLHVWGLPRSLPFRPRNHRAQAGLGKPFIWLHAAGVGSEHCWRRQRQRAGWEGSVNGNSNVGWGLDCSPSQGAWCRHGGGQAVLEDPHPTLILCSHILALRIRAQSCTHLPRDPTHWIPESLLESPTPSGFWGFTDG